MSDSDTNQGDARTTLDFVSAPVNKGNSDGSQSPTSIDEFPEDPVSNKDTSSVNDCQECKRKCSACEIICNTQNSNEANAKIKETLHQLQQKKEQEQQMLEQLQLQKKETALVPATRDQIKQKIVDKGIQKLITDFDLKSSSKPHQTVLSFDFGSIQIKTKSSSWSSRDQWRESVQYKILIYTNNKKDKIFLMLYYPSVTKISRTRKYGIMKKIILQGKKSGNFMGNRDSKNTHRVDMLCNTTEGDELFELAMDSERYKNLKKVLEAFNSGNNYDLEDYTDMSDSEVKRMTKETLQQYYNDKQQKKGPSVRLMGLRTAQAPRGKEPPLPPGWSSLRRGGDSRDNKKMSKNTTKKHKRLSKHYTRRKKRSQHKTRKKKHSHHHTHKKRSRHNINKKTHTSIKRRPRHNTRKKRKH